MLGPTLPPSSTALFFSHFPLPTTNTSNTAFYAHQRDDILTHAVCEGQDFWKKIQSVYVGRKRERHMHACMAARTNRAICAREMHTDALQDFINEPHKQISGARRFQRLCGGPQSNELGMHRFLARMIPPKVNGGV
mmetsp:Transcript_41091/g.81071  ORF Transcript_41091/g.81071 Transcript_41091/m.81071 type:complete len:136 (+) Transcript_41091:376-783(+)